MNREIKGDPTETMIWTTLASMAAAIGASTIPATKSSDGDVRRGNVVEQKVPPDTWKKDLNEAWMDPQVVVVVQPENAIDLPSGAVHVPDSKSAAVDDRTMQMMAPCILIKVMTPRPTSPELEGRALVRAE